jgi:thiamine kinase-like enzyme
LSLLDEKGPLKIIDFEYSTLNYRGIDLAAYINENSINYSVPGGF